MSKPISNRETYKPAKFRRAAASVYREGVSLPKGAVCPVPKKFPVYC